MVNPNGVIVPATDDLNVAVTQLVDGLINNPDTNVRFRANPVGYFQAIGIPTDGVSELMTELGLGQEAAAVAICGYWSCFWTSGCAITCWNTGTAAAAITLTAHAEPFQQG